MGRSQWISGLERDRHSLSVIIILRIPAMAKIFLALLSCCLGLACAGGLAESDKGIVTGEGVNLSSENTLVKREAFPGAGKNNVKKKKKKKSQKGRKKSNRGKKNKNRPRKYKRKENKGRRKMKKQKESKTKTRKKKKKKKKKK